MLVIAATRWIVRRFGPEERAARVVALVLASIMLDVMFFQVGRIWSFFAEEDIRLRTNHLSYRAFYTPWERHKVVVVIVGMALFWTVAGAGLWLRSPSQRT
jgi:hypothetical protein